MCLFIPSPVRGPPGDRGLAHEAAQRLLGQRLAAAARAPDPARPGDTPPCAAVAPGAVGPQQKDARSGCNGLGMP
eukprot:9127446-Pyramimonas_sp.AAC.1